MKLKEVKEKLINNIEELIEIDKTEFNGKYTKQLVTFRDVIKENLNFKILCLGDFSSGKTTFINNFFLKKDLLPTKVTPTTAKITVIKYAEEKKIVIKSKEKTFTLDSNEKETLDKILTEHSDSETVVYVYYPSDILKEDIEVIDSPGLNDPDEKRMELTYQIIDAVDSVLYFLTATQAWKHSEKDFLEKMVLSKKHLDKVIFVMNYWDTVEDQESREELLEYVQDNMRKSLKIAEERIYETTGEKVELSMPKLIPVSAKTGENFDILSSELSEYFETIDKDKILKTNINKFNGFIDRYLILIKERQEELSKNKEELENLILKLQEEVEKYQADIETVKETIFVKAKLAYEKFVQSLETSTSEMINLVEKRIQTAFEIYKKDPKKLSQEKIETIVKNAIREGSIFLQSKFIEAIDRFISDINNIVREEKSRLNLTKIPIKEQVDIDDIPNIEDIDIPSEEILSKIFGALGIASLSGTIVDSILFIYAKALEGQGVLSNVTSFLFGKGILLNSVLWQYSLLFGIAMFVGSLSIRRWLLDKQKEKFEIQLLKIIENVRYELEQKIKQEILKLKQKENEVANKILESIQNSVIKEYNEKVKELEKIIKLKEDSSVNEHMEQIKAKLESLKL